VDSVKSWRKLQIFVKMIRKCLVGSVQGRLRNGLMRHGCRSAIIGARSYNSSVWSKNSPIKKQSKSTLALNTEEYYENSSDEKVFPSIIIDKNGIKPQGSFAEAQTEFLDPDMDTVHTISNKLSKANMGIVAHYYMDVELQSVLQQVSKLQDVETRQRKGNNVPIASNVAIADSLAMGEYAVKMVQENNISSIACLGVDFMAESVSAILERNGYGHVPVYRSTPQSIGCSLAASAETETYEAWLRQAASNDYNKLHVIYINTSLETKALSASIIPTITCTSSNVIKTILQASSQIDDLHIYFGPDTYMGQNLLSFFTQIIDHPNWNDDKIKSDLHPSHDNNTLAKLRDNIHVFPSGNCVVHHMFGDDVVEHVKQQYDDAYITAHLEVPSEMFNIAMNKSIQDKGVVGSTSDILKFISNKVQHHSQTTKNQRLQFVLGTEAGMVTSIVRNVQDILNTTHSNIQAEIIFPVASDAVTPVNDQDLLVVPGVSASEGCSTSGGCATCPFMKMNDINALEDVIDLVIQKQDTKILMNHLPPNKLSSAQNKQRFGNVNPMDLAVQPIMFMRNYMNGGVICEDLIKRIEE